MLNCTNCQALLPSGAMHCPNCGMPLSMPASYPSPVQGGYGVNPPAGANPPSQDGYSVETVPGYGLSPSSASYPNFPPSGPPAYGGMPQTAYGGPPNSGTSLPGIAQQPYVHQVQPSYPGQSYYDNASPLQPTPPPQGWPGRSLSRNQMILAVSLALVLILGGFGLIYYTLVAHPAQQRADATATVQARRTADAYTTATVQAQVTGTAQAYAHATATVRAQMQATATAQQALYADATKGPPTLSSPLAFQDNANWEVYNAVGGGGCAFTGNALHSSVAQKNYYAPCFARATNFSNFAMEVQMTIVKGDEGGLIFRANSVTSNFYYFRIGRDGIYSLYVAKDNNHSTPLVYDMSPAIKTGAGQTNILSVIARGGSIYLYINKQFVGSASDNSYASGQIGIFAGDNANATDVAFNNVRVWSL